jgi:hypothetical protein
MAIVVIRYETKTAARRALTFIVRIFVNDTIALTCLLLCSPLVRTGRAIQGSHEPDCFSASRFFAEPFFFEWLRSLLFSSGFYRQPGAFL